MMTVVNRQRLAEAVNSTRYCKFDASMAAISKVVEQILEEEAAEFAGSNSNLRETVRVLTLELVDRDLGSEKIIRMPEAA